MRFYLELFLLPLLPVAVALYLAPRMTNNLVRSWKGLRSLRYLIGASIYLGLCFITLLLLQTPQIFSSLGSFASNLDTAIRFALFLALYPWGLLLLLLGLVAVVLTIKSQREGRVKK